MALRDSDVPDVGTIATEVAAVDPASARYALLSLGSVGTAMLGLAAACAVLAILLAVLRGMFCGTDAQMVATAKRIIRVLIVLSILSAAPVAASAVYAAVGGGDASAIWQVM